MSGFRTVCGNAGRRATGDARRGAEVATGRFRSHMLVELENDGPVTLTIDV